MVNALDDAVLDIPRPPKDLYKDVKRGKPSKSMPKRETSPRFVYSQDDKGTLPDRTRAMKDVSRGLSKSNEKTFNEGEASSDGDPIEMVEAGLSADSAYAKKSREPQPLRRSATTAKKSDGLIGGLFGTFRKGRRATEPIDRPKSRGALVDEENVVRRKRTVVRSDHDPKRLRRDERKVKRSERPEAEAETDEFVADAVPNGNASTETEEAGLRRELRRTRREPDVRESRKADLKEMEARQARGQLKDKAATEVRKAQIRAARDKAAKRNEGDDQEREDEVTLRGMKDEKPKDDGLIPDLDTRPPKRRSKHRTREFDDSNAAGNISSRNHQSHRQRSHTDRPFPTNTLDEDVRREERRSRRTLTERPSSNRRRKSAAPVEDYFDPRNSQRAPPLDSDPYQNTGVTDHTSTWVNRQIIEPPPPPPIEPTVIEAPPVLGDGLVDEEPHSEVRTRRKASRRRSKFMKNVADEGDEKRKKRDKKDKEIRSSEGSAEDRAGRRKNEIGGPRAFDGRPVEAGPGKRASWFKKITNL